MYLDAVLKPNGEILILDEDELKDALDNGKITQDEYGMAYDVLERLINNGILSVSYMEELCQRLQLLFKI